MKKSDLYVFLFNLILCCVHISNVFAQNQYAKSTATSPINIQPIRYQLTTNDELNYILTAGQPIKIKRDTSVYKLAQNDFHIYQQKEDQIIIPVKFINNSNDTLEYIGMECSWWDIYLTNNPNIEIQSDKMCFKDGPTVIKIASKDSSIVNIAVGCPKVMSKDTKFRIGMIVQKCQGGLFDIPVAQKSNTIWTDEIGIP